MITFVCWKWTDPRAGRTFSSAHVNVLASAIARNYRLPHRLVCMTDEPEGLAPEVVHLPMPRTGFEDLLNPSARPESQTYTSPMRGQHGRLRPGYLRIRRQKSFPSCYRRLWNFSREAREQLGPRIMCIDIDVIICGDITSLVQRPGSFVGWVDERFGWNKIAGGAYLMDTGAHPDVFEDFNPDVSPALAKSQGFEGSDQAWMSYKLFDRIPATQHWQGGLIKLKWIRNGERPAAAKRLIFTSGDSPPWDPEVQARYPWIKEHWR